MKKLKTVAAVIATAAIGGIMLTNSDVEKTTSEQVQALEQLIIEREANGQSTTMQVQEMARLKIAEDQESSLLD